MTRSRLGTTTTDVVSAFPAERGRAAVELVFEYMAATQAETGQLVPATISELPAPLQHECRNLAIVYRAPGALLIAGSQGQPAGCVGLTASSAEHTAEIKRLYVRPAYRGRGIANALMSHAHDHAARHGLTRLVLDVLPTRTGVISFYRRLGYTEAEAEAEAEAEPNATKSPIPMIFMERPVTSGDILSIRA